MPWKNSHSQGTGGIVPKAAGRPEKTSWGPPVEVESRWNSVKPAMSGHKLPETVNECLIEIEK